ncbi:hypothetical protein [Sporomusa acidovorans]|uniref:hypothetical protein n=1 Tax=Sporomusa acidovorans TaxID=112900 RepID=UPI0015A012B5|nr:hypothetical protein [Sporomusa acidovorans]
MKAARCLLKTNDKTFPVTLAKYAIISVTDCRGAVSHTLFRKGGGMMTMFEAMYLMIAFATLVVLIIKKE